MTSEKSIDLVVRFRNEEYWLKYFVEAIKLQTGVNINAVGINNRSLDRSEDIFSQLLEADCVSSLKIIQLDSFLPGLALNLGAHSGSSPYIVNISSHCIPKNTTYLLELIQEIEVEDDMCAGVFGGQLPLPCSGAQNTIDLILTYPREQRIYRRTPIFNNANSIIKREVFESLNFDDEVSNLEDVIWAKSMLENGYELKYTPKAAVYHYHGPHQHSHLSGRAEKSLDVLKSKNWISIDEPKFLDIYNKEVLLINSSFQPSLEALLASNLRFLKGGKFFNLDSVNKSTSFLDTYDHILYSTNLSDKSIIEFAKECFRMASEVSYLDEDNSIVFYDFTYGKSSTEDLLTRLADKKNVLLSSRVARLLIYGNTKVA